MLLGFISLMLTVSQEAISNFCIPKHLTHHFLPCKLEAHEHVGGEEPTSSHERHPSPVDSHERKPSHVASHERRLLAEAALSHCEKIRSWKRWEDAIEKENYNADDVLKPKFIDVHDHAFIKRNFWGFRKDIAMLRWVNSFIEQCYASVTRSDYITMRLGFIMMHCRETDNLIFTTT